MGPAVSHREGQAGAASPGSHREVSGTLPGGHGHFRMVSDNQKVSHCRDHGEEAPLLQVCPEYVGKPLGKTIQDFFHN